MSAPNSLSSLSGHHPAVWPAVPCTNVQQLASPSRKLPSPTFLRRRRINKNRHLHSTLPNWTRLSGGDQDAASNHTHQDQLSKQPDNQPQRLAATYSTPQTASAAYNCGLLKSDDNISSNALRIRLAFRYHLTSQFQHQDDKLSSIGDDNVDDIDDDLLYLCWVRQDGIPCHFRKLMPFEKNHNNSNNNRGKTAMRGGSTAILQADKVEPSESIDSNGNSDALFVNEHDTIERTFPGHAFVFCRRIANYNHRQYIIDDDDGNIDINTRPRVVHGENGHTIFLRRKKKQQSDDESSSSSSSQKEDKEEIESHKGGKGNMSEDKHSGNNGGDDWEAYLVVGGFRPGPMPHPSSSPAVEDKASESESNKSVDSDEVESTSNDGDSTDDDSDSDDEMELRVQLVTIRRAKMPIPADIEQDHASITTSLLCDSAQSEISAVAVDASTTPSQLDQILDDLKAPVDVSSKHYDHVTLGGWPCRIEPGCFHHSSEKECRENGKCSLQSRFETDIAAACQSLPPMAREKLQLSTPIWINKSHMWGPRVAPIRGRDACFHPGAQWLSRNGDNPLKCGGVEFYDAKHYLSDCDHWGPGGLILHELSHAWHNIHVANGYDNEQIEECYEMAMKDGLYDCVRVHGSQGPKCKAYACTDPMEYFAELSVAFLGGLDDTLEHNKWFPFNRTQLREHDPRAFDILCRMWGVDEDNDEEMEEK